MIASRKMGHTPDGHAPSARNQPERGSFPFRSAGARRPRLADEERRLLKETEAAFEGGERRPDADAPAHHGPWEVGDDAPAAETTHSRLFRD